MTEKNTNEINQITKQISQIFDGTHQEFQKKSKQIISEQEDKIKQLENFKNIQIESLERNFLSEKIQIENDIPVHYN
jgi:predicted RNA binding protein with dsRBD fold (UPF0201 family)